MMLELRSMSARPRTAATDILLEFLRCAIHTALCGLEVYPRDTFQLRRVRGTEVYVSKARSLVDYIHTSVESLREMIHNHQVESLDLNVVKKKHICKLIFNFPPAPEHGPRELDCDLLPSHRGFHAAFAALREQLYRLTPPPCSEEEAKAPGKGSGGLPSSGLRPFETQTNPEDSNAQLNTTTDKSAGTSGVSQCAPWWLSSNTRIPLSPQQLRTESLSDRKELDLMAAAGGLESSMVWSRFLCDWIGQTRRASVVSTKPIIIDSQPSQSSERNSHPSPEPSMQPLSILRLPLVSSRSPAPRRAPTIAPSPFLTRKGDRSVQEQEKTAAPSVSVPPSDVVVVITATCIPYHVALELAVEAKTDETGEATVAP